jgi:transcriptional regulator with GAF, ATPase, and Fis domain
VPDRPSSKATDTLERVTADNEGCVLRVVEGPDAGKSLELTSGSAVVGTKPECQLRLTDSAVSGRHLGISITADGFLVSDLGSTNGTFYLETRIEKAVVQRGATLTLGHSRVMLASREHKNDPAYSPRDSYGALVGASASMRRLYALLEQLEKFDYTALLLGETGAGKELVAREIHAHSGRNNAPFEVCDCAALSPTLIESELFGHVRGAFTGADTNRTGVFELADGGTLFLDEIGELPLDLQPKLLRVLERREIRPVGGRQTKTVDVRVIAATHRDLYEAVQAGRFREDLYFRLNVVTVEVPPLRQRREDIPMLLQELSRTLGHPNLELSKSTVELFTTGYDWPGNVRELRNALSRVMVTGAPPPNMKPTTMKREESVVNVDAAFHGEKKRIVDAFERDYLTAKLKAANNNISKAARDAGVERKHFRDLLVKHGLLPQNES